MSISSLPTEIFQQICRSLSSNDLFALIRVSKRLHAGFIRSLYDLARHRVGPQSVALTKGLTDVTFWFDREIKSSVIEWAVVNHHLDTYKQLLLVPQIDLLQADTFGVTLLHRLSAQGRIEYMRILIRRLKSLRLDPFQADLSSLTPLHYAAGRGMTEAVRLLIEEGASVSAQDHHGNTPLHLAAITGSHRVFGQLERAGSSVASESRFGWLPVDQASFAQRHTAVNKLRKLGSRPPMLGSSDRALDEFVRLSPCPIECYALHLKFSKDHL